MGSGEVVEEVFAVVVEEEVDFVEDDYCVYGSGFLFESALEVGGVVSALYLFVREFLEDLFQGFVLGVVFSAVDVAGVDVVRELV